MTVYSVACIENEKSRLKDFRYSVYDEYKPRTYREFYDAYIAEGLPHDIAFNKAIGDARNESYKPQKVLHVVTDEELKAMPKGVKNKPPKEPGTYCWRAPAFQELTVCEDVDPYEGYAEILLGNLKPGDKVPIRMVPKKPFGYDMEYLIFVKYAHTFPTCRHWCHDETLVFTDRGWKTKRFPAFVCKPYAKGNLELIQGLASVLSYWNMCRLCNDEPMFISLPDILAREKTLSWNRKDGMVYQKDIIRIDTQSGNERFQEPIACLMIPVDTS